MQDPKVKTRIINHFFNNNNVPDYRQNIAESIGAQKSGVGTQCKKLVDNGILIYKQGFVRSRGITPYYYLSSSITSLFDIYEYADKSDLMHSDYYKKMIPQIVKCFAESIPPMPYEIIDVDWKVPTETDLQDDLGHLRDTCNLKYGTSDADLSPEDYTNISESLESNISTLKFIKYFISIDEESRLNLISDICNDLRDPYCSPVAAYIDGYMECINNMELDATIPEHTIMSIYKDITTKRQDESEFLWSAFFGMIDSLDKHYPFLFK